MTLRYFPYSLELKEPFGTAHGTRTHTKGMIVSLKFEGSVGYGEVFMPPYYPEDQKSMAEFFSMVDAESMLASNGMEEALDYVRVLVKENEGAKTALDIALHDLFGKIRGESVRDIYSRWTMDNGQWTNRDPDLSAQHSDFGTQASVDSQDAVPGTQFAKCPGTSFTIGIDKIDTMVRKAREAQEFETLKVKLNGENDVAVIEAIRGVTDQELFVDANQGWTEVDTAVGTCERLVKLGVGMIEQPFPKGEAEKAGRLKAQCAVPVIADEDVQTADDIEHLAEFYDGINIKLMKAGGIREANKMIAVARTHGLKVLLGCMTESSIGISAAAQIAHLADWCDLDGNLLIKNDTCSGVETVDGQLILSDSPGIGITDDSKLKAIFEADL